MELANLRDRFPVLDGLILQATGFVARRRVVLAADDRVLILVWWDQGEEQLIQTDLPPDLIQQGLPLQRNVLAEMVADLLVDQSLSPHSVELELLLPLPSCQWRLLDGAAGLEVTSLRRLSPDLNWSLQWQESYLTLKSMVERESSLLVGVDRVMLQAWIETVALADVGLRQAEWLLVAAWRGLQALNDDLQGEWIWLIEHLGQWRLVVLCDGLPELDVSLQTSQVEPLREEVLFFLDAWDEKRHQVATDRSWWVTAGQDWQGSWAAGHQLERHGPIVSDGEWSLLQLALKAPSAVGS